MESKFSLLSLKKFNVGGVKHLEEMCILKNNLNVGHTLICMHFVFYLQYFHNFIVIIDTTKYKKLIELVYLIINIILYLSKELENIIKDMLAFKNMIFKFFEFQ